MFADKLKKSVLQAAIQGKLTEQLSTDGDAKDLLKKIREEKSNLIAEGKIKSEKILPPIQPEEIPFDIPKNWQWIRLGEVSEIYTGNSISESEKKSKYLGLIEGFSYIGTKDVSFDGKIDYDNGVKIPFQNNFRRALKNSVLLCIEGGSAGRKIALTDREVCFGNKLCNFYSESIFNSYIYFYLQSPAFRKNFYDNLSGMIGGVSIKKLNLIPICLPPLSEQKRIVERLEKILSEVELLAESERELDNLQKNFPRRMKNSILQAAIQGKLTEQLSTDGDARELLKKIREEKSKLIAEGKIKSEKILPSIQPDEIPFNIPKNWQWVRLGEICQVKGGKRLPVGNKLTKIDTGHKYIRVVDMKNGTVSDRDLHFVPEEVYPKIKGYIITSDDVYITCAGTIGRVGTIPEKFNQANLTENADRLVIISSDKNWLKYFLSSNFLQEQITEATTKVGQPKLAIKRIEQFLIPLPPLAEQKRIVERLEELLPLCEI